MKKIILITIFLISSVFAAVDAKLEIVKKANTLPKILISVASDTAEISTLSQIKNLLSKDLEISGHFEVLNIQHNRNYNELPDLNTLSNENVDLYLNLSAVKNATGGYSLLTKLYDINAQAMILEKSFTTSRENRFPFLAHRTAISINDHFKAPSIKWMDKFVIYSVYNGAGKANIMIGDYTLTYEKTIVQGGLNIFPKWASKDQKSIYYTSYNYDRPTLVKLNIFTRDKKVIMSSDGMIACSDVSDDASKLLITASPSGQPDIYSYDTNTGKKTRVTTYSGIDVSGQFIEDDSRIVFVSDRLGSPNIFAKSINSRGVEKLVYHSRNNSSATSYKDNIVYASKDSDNELSAKSFNLYLMSTKSDDLKRLTSSGINQFPKFSPDGESLLFIKSFNGISSVGIIRLNFNKSYLFPSNNGRIQSIDW
ncbi:Tol-Pal system protein TolB [Poseidonibacter ostreae]|uniref:Tol-Pal system protein TolB n=1 Tax=Poseidonibacter ostreae TaxID=2654171 RepID=A0ABQ6VPX1_9BACT|nr:Tol-Pal system protein TolB [Poseidonibacter ostreae]KAB7892640.1 Tol-Pal system protein TolB [Poseidonibacter ostreae]